ncbi:MAG: hypothetical protein KA112_01915 [Alphaproteobacteria bacterium]|nr:hypothetical protein [Alphaproteobacteria bacterium]MBP7729359.1 hypothetical protein [Alphaproteobacteria bacterium]
MTATDGLLIAFKLSVLLFFLPVTLYSLFHYLNFKGNYTFALSMGLSPTLLSWFYMVLLRFAPGHSSTFYLLLTTVPLVFSSLQPSILPNFLKEFSIFKPIFEEKIYLTITGFLLLFILLWYINMPLLGNDSLEYFYISHLIDVKKDLGFYPNVSSVDSQGLLAPFTHPIGYPALLAWGQLTLGAEFGLFTGKVLSFLCIFLTLFVACIIQIKENIKPCMLFSLIFLTTPLVYSNVLEAHIDSIRMLLFLLAIIALYDHFTNQGSLILVGVSCGLSWFAHSSGLLTLAVVLGTYGFFSLLQDRCLSIRVIKNIFVGSSIIIFSSLFFVLLDVIKIYSVHGRLIGDLENIQIITYLSNEYEHYFAVSRKIGSLDEKFFRLVEQLFFSPFEYGFSYWLGVIGIFLCFKPTVKDLRDNKWDYMDFIFTVVFFFFVIVILATLLGKNTFVFNPRYLLQALPLVAFFGILSLRRLLNAKI